MTYNVFGGTLNLAQSMLVPLFYNSYALLLVRNTCTGRVTNYARVCKPCLAKSLSQTKTLEAVLQ